MAKLNCFLCLAFSVLFCLTAVICLRLCFDDTIFMPARYDEAFENEVVFLVNRHRTENGVHPLVKSDPLCKDCRLHSFWMQKTGKFRHANGVYECIAMGQHDADELVDDWMNSDGHRRLILTERFHDVGIGRCGKYFTLRFE